MLPRSTIFDSHNEEQLFAAIHGSWEPEYHVYPHVPFANCVELDPQQLSVEEISYLYKTTVDFVLADRANRPLLGIEFDGLGHGISRDGRYVPLQNSTRDPKRGWKLDVKCRVARKAGFRFIIISYDEKAVLDADLGLVVCHGIIGNFLRTANVPRLIQDGMAEAQDDLDQMTPAQRYNYVQFTIAIAADIDAEMAYNPIVRRAVALGMEARELGWCGMESHQPLDPSEPPFDADPANPDFDLDARLRWLDARPKCGARVSVETADGTISTEAWVRNGDFPGGSADSLADDIAGLQTWKAVRDRYRDHGRGPADSEPPTIRIGY